jgi:subtilisin family serine protease
MSAPFVSGTAALLLALHPAWTRSEILDRLASSARPALPLTPDQVGRLGVGALDVAAALAPDSPVLVQPVPAPPGLPWTPQDPR